MATTAELLRQGRRDEIWKKYCGFLDLGMEEFMEIQRRLLMEQIDLLSKCELGRKLLGEKVPTSVEEFRQTVPLTTYYDDYLPYLAEKREDVLPVKPVWWLHTSGRSGFGFKWVPYTQEAVRKLGECALAGMIFASCSKRGEFVFEEGDTMLQALAPFPYVSGAIARRLQEEFSFTFLPPLEEADKMGFQERIQKGFHMALKSGLDIFNGVSSVLVKIGEQFRQGAGTLSFSASLLHPKVLFRLIRGVIRSRMAGRSYLLPKDLWDVKCVGTGSTDTALFRHQIEEYWGRTPIELYGATEATALLIVQGWNAKGMTFFPDIDFLEFIPEEEHIKSKEDLTYQPSTLLLDEVKPGKTYELVITNFMGGIFVRYRIGDLIKIISLEDEEIGVALPQAVFYSRGDDVIDLASFTRLTERDVWQAIEEAGVAYVDWTARKEYLARKPVLQLYIELKEERDQEEVKRAVHRRLREIHKSYGELEDMLGIDPLQVTLLPPASFARYYQDRQKEGADLAHLKPPHMNPSDEIIDRLLSTPS
jgi:hypothetical protein